MSRLVTCGFETGILAEAGVQVGADNATIVNTGDGIRSGSYALALNGATTDITGAGRRWALPSVSEIYFSFSIYFLTYSSTPNSCLYIGNDSDLVFQWEAGPSGSQISAGATSSVPNLGLNVRTLVEGHLKLDNSAGIAEVWFDGEKVFDFTGDTQVGSSPMTDFIFLQGNRNLDFVIDDLKINDTSGTVENAMPGRGGIILLKPNGAGTTTELTPSAGANYECVNEVPASMTDYVEGDTAGNGDTYALEDLSSLYNKITLVQPVVFGQLAAAGEGNVKTVIRSGGTDYADAAAQGLADTAKVIVGDVYYTDPADSEEWTKAKVDALEVGVEVSA